MWIHSQDIAVITDVIVAIFIVSCINIYIIMSFDMINISIQNEIDCRESA